MVSWDELIAPNMAGAQWDADGVSEHRAASLWSVMDGLDIGLALWRSNGTLLQCNRPFRQLFGKGHEACRPGASLQQMLVLASAAHRGREQVPTGMGRLLDAHRTCSTAEWRGVDGRWWHARFSLHAAGQRLCRVLDISHQKRLEQECRQLAEVSAREIPLAKGLAHMGHELRTPLNAILGFSDLIRSEAIGPLGHPSYVEYANDIHDSGQVLLTAVDRIALLVKLESGLVRPQSEEVSYRALISAAMETVQPIAAEAGVTLQDYSDKGEVMLFADRFLVSNILTYLLENAIAATPPGGSVEVHCRGNGDGSLAFEVRDRGKGIARDVIELIREPFVRRDSANPRCPAGVGMGLPVADRMAALLNCTIVLDTAPDRGTAARLIVPAERVVQASPDLSAA